VKIVTAEVMRALDRRAMDEGGIPGVVLMENAGRAVFEFLAERFSPLRGRPFRVVCGTGNNGGDGFVTARHLLLAGALPTVSLIGDDARISGDARVHYEIMRRVGVEVAPLPPRPPGPQSWGYDGCVKVDALFGTGFSGAPRPEAAAAITWMNSAPLPTIAVDIPSGVDSDTGATPGEAVRADATVTFAYPKLGQFLLPGADLVGELIVRDIGFAWDAVPCDTPFRWLRREGLRGLLTKRPRESHKGLYGHVLIVGGSRGMSGAPTLAAKAALRTGAGLVTVAAPESAQPIIAGKVDEAMTVPVTEADGSLCEASFEAIASAARRATVLCLGPGATQLSEAQALLRRVAREVDLPVVIDADGLNALTQQPDCLMRRAAPTVLTPHPGECARLLDLSTDEVQAERVEAVRAAAKKFHAVVVLKGARTLVCDRRAPQGDVLPISVNTTGNPGMATGGSGDALTGVIGALMGQGLGAYEAACLGAYVHGRAGDLAAEVTGERGLLPTDLINALPRALRELEAEE
jgi:ADP-dependent NAD(P)H-hydrate dehydratase / NAD(P)H-hydrate epimerase